MDLEFRSAEVAGVSFPRRTIELIVMPYEQPTQVDYHGRVITEICSRGAYDGIERRTSQIRVNVEHDPRRTIGKTVALHPSRPDGLVAEIRISKIVPDGDNALEAADDGILDASAGFALLAEGGRVKPGAEVWESRDRRRLNHLFLDHIALTGAPAYPGAKVLAVRNLPEAPERRFEAVNTPNLDRLELERLRSLAADIDVRYGVSR